MSNTLAIQAKIIEGQVDNHFKNVRSSLTTLQAKLEEEQDVARRAAAMGDKSENAEWQIANDNIARLVVSIMDLTETLDTYDRYKASYVPTGKVMVGSTLKVTDLSRNAVLYLKLYPKGLGNAKIGAVAATTPFGVAVLGKVAGTEVIVKAPLGELKYRIEEVL